MLVNCTGRSIGDCFQFGNAAIDVLVPAGFSCVPQVQKRPAVQYIRGRQGYIYQIGHVTFNYPWEIMIQMYRLRKCVISRCGCITGEGVTGGMVVGEAVIGGGRQCGACTALGQMIACEGMAAGIGNCDPMNVSNLPSLTRRVSVVMS